MLVKKGKKKSATPRYGVGFQLQRRAINPPATRCFTKPANGGKVQRKHSGGADQVEKQVLLYWTL